MDDFLDVGAFGGSGPLFSGSPKVSLGLFRVEDPGFGGGRVDVLEFICCREFSLMGLWGMKSARRGYRAL